LDLGSEPRFKKDYAVVIDEETFEVAKSSTKLKRALIAGTIGGVRLIDNMVVA
jgi:pantoate--beta-alanine ligase